MSRVAFRAVKPLLLFLALVSAALAGAAGVGASPSAACLPSVHTIAGANYQVFCGTARVAVKFGGKTVRLTGGGCTKNGVYFTINVGAAYLGSPGTKPKRPYFGIAMGKVPIAGLVGDRPVTGDGTYTAPLSFDLNGTGYTAVNAKITLAGGRTKGSFSGTLLEGGTASGSFTC